MTGLYRYHQVLLIDNNAEDNFNARNTILRTGLAKEVVVKINGKEAVDYLSAATQYPELIIYQNDLPKVDGVLFLHELHGLPIAAKGKAKLIVLADYGIHFEFENLIRNGQVFGLFQKPLTQGVCEILARDGISNQYPTQEFPLI